MRKILKNNLRRFLIMSLIFSAAAGWIFSGWPQLLEFRIQNIEYRVPPEIREARAATSIKYPAGNNGGWDANETYAYADDTSYASTAPGVNSTESVEYGNFGFDSSVPAGATINSVTIELVWYVSTAASVATLRVDALVNNGVVGTQQSDATEPLSDKLTSYANNYASWNRDSLLDGVFEIRVGAQRGSGSTGYTMYLDYVKVTVDYSPVIPTVTTQAADPVGDTTATCNGTITATGGANATAVGCEWDTDSGAPYANNPSTAGDYGAAPFTQALTSLPSGTTIYARAFATNSAGTGYGSEVSFLTKIISVTLDQENFDYGKVANNTASSTLNLWSGAGITATNGSAIADFYVYGANSTGSGGGWTLADNTTGNNYIHKFCDDTEFACDFPPTNYTALTTSPVLLEGSVAGSGTVRFQLEITTPTTPTDLSPQNAVVTIQASAP